MLPSSSSFVCVYVCIWLCLCNDSLHTHVLLYMRTPDINTGDLPQPEYSPPYFLIQGFLLNLELLILLGWLANGPQGSTYCCLPSPLFYFYWKYFFFIKYMPPHLPDLLHLSTLPNPQLLPLSLENKENNNNDDIKI